MSNLLIDQSGIPVGPELAIFVGLNEAIFLQQLHFILTNNDSVGQFVDGKKWYRDKPIDFAEKYFPYWDESVVKRTIANLRKDGLILARADLNKIKKDRSLWYTINYPAIEKLNEPVPRLVKKSEKRKMARQSRIDSDYTKVQNVLLVEGEEKSPPINPNGTEVQSVLNEDKSTLCTLDQSTNCTLLKVQNVPTPKDSLLKTPLPKDCEEKSPSHPPPKEIKKKFSPKQELMLSIAELCQYEIKVIGSKQWKLIKIAAEKLQKVDATLIEIDGFGGWWYANDWRGLKNQPPSPPNIQEKWGEFKTYEKGKSDETKMGLTSQQIAAVKRLQAESEASKAII
jgi:hypothetical protein